MPAGIGPPGSWVLEDEGSIVGASAVTTPDGALVHQITRAAAKTITVVKAIHRIGFDTFMLPF
jgi:hypothetical protein